MKIKNALLIPAITALFLPAFTSCGEDRWPEYAPLIELDQWISATMRENYLWYADIPADKELNLFSEPGVFLRSIVSQEDNNLSYIDTLNNSNKPGYGFNYTLYRIANNDTAYNALITDILPQSPAASAGLKRGEWIMKVDNHFITKKSETRLLDNGKPLKLQLGNYTTKKDPDTDATVGIVVEKRKADIAAPQVVENNPLHYYRVITTPGGIKAGYLVYNRFLAGTPSDPEKYNNQLRALSRRMSEEGVTHFILDLRYNSGGALSCAQLLATLLAPADALNTPLGKLEYNDKQSKKNRTLLFDPALLAPNGTNLNIQQGFILSSAATSGLSATLLNWFFPLQRWGIVGSNIACQGVATEPFVNPSKTWSLNPVVCQVFNSEGKSNRGGSFTTKFLVNETADFTRFLPFGDEKEALLQMTIGVIDGTYPPEPATR